MGSLIAATPEALTRRREFEAVETFCQFIGYSRSGHTLVGSLLNAHRHVVIAHELDAMKWIRRRVTRAQFYALLLRRDRWFTRRGSRWAGYAYAVPGQHQGTYEELRVVGDKFGSETSWALAADPSTLQQLRARVGVPLKLIHVVRDPFDNVATMFLRSEGDLDGALTNYLAQVDTVQRTAEVVGEDMITVHHESMVTRPREELQRLCQFLGLEADEDYLAAAAGIVFDSPRRTRDRVEWAQPARERLLEGIERYPFLRRYKTE